MASRGGKHAPANGAAGRARPAGGPPGCLNPSSSVEAGARRSIVSVHDGFPTGRAPADRRLPGDVALVAVALSAAPAVALVAARPPAPRHARLQQRRPLRRAARAVALGALLPQPQHGAAFRRRGPRARRGRRRPVGLRARQPAAGRAALHGRDEVGRALPPPAATTTAPATTTTTTTAGADVRRPQPEPRQRQGQPQRLDDQRQHGGRRRRQPARHRPHPEPAGAGHGGRHGRAGPAVCGGVRGGGGHGCGCRHGGRLLLPPPTTTAPPTTPAARGSRRGRRQAPSPPGRAHVALCHLLARSPGPRQQPHRVARATRRHGASQHVAGGQGRQEEAHAAHLQRPADLRAREDLRADQVPGGPRARQARLRPRHDRVPGQGVVPEPAHQVAQEARGRDGDGEAQAGGGGGAGRRGQRRRRVRPRRRPGPRLQRRQAAAPRTGGRGAGADGPPLSRGAAPREPHESREPRKPREQREPRGHVCGRLQRSLRHRVCGAHGKRAAVPVLNGPHLLTNIRLGAV